MLDGYTKEVPEDIALIKVPDFSRPELITAFQQLALISTNRPKSIVIEVNAYRKYVPILIKAYCKQSEGMKKAAMQIDRCTDIEYDRANKRWTKEEDEEIINRICAGEMNIHELSTVFGRSPGAIQTHISELVGRKRLSQEVAGRFIGMIDGKSTEGNISGTVYK